MNNENYTNKNKKPNLLKYAILWVVVLGVIIVCLSVALKSGSKVSYKWSFSEAEYALTNDTSDNSDMSDFAKKYSYSQTNVTSVEVDLNYIKNKIVITYLVSDKKIATGTYEWSGEEYTAKIQKAWNIFEENNDIVVKQVDASTQFTFADFLIYVLPTLLTIIVVIIVIRSFMKANGGANQTFDFGKSKARIEDASNVKFSDVAGCEDEKEEMKELVDYLKNPKKYSKSGARIPKGVILKGHPGTGKTLLAKAVAGEASVPFYYISGSDFLEMFVGVGASRVRDMFKQARASAPCIVFIDEIDAIGRQRGTGLGGGHDEREQTLNQLLVEMDGFENNSGVIVLAATNRIDILDPALLRPGRFDRQIEVSLPDLNGRIAILKVHSRNKKLADDVSLESIAKRTPGFSGAELESVLNEAAILSVRNNHEIISNSDIDEGIDRVMGGPAKKTKVISDRCKKMVAYHEAGHAVVGLKIANAEVVQKITIIPRGDAGGYVLMTPKEDTYLQTKGELKAKIISYLAGRASEEIFFDDITTGAVSDIESATSIARAMVGYLGMSDLGPIKYESSSHEVFLGRDYGSANKSSDAIANEIDLEVRKIISESFEIAKNTINENKDLLILIAEALLKYETITADEIDFLVKYGSLDAYDVYKEQSEKKALKDKGDVKDIKEIISDKVKEQNGNNNN